MSVNYGRFISAEHLQDLGYCMIALSTAFIAARFGIRVWKRRFWIIEDVTMFMAYSCCTAMNVGYVYVTPAMYRIAEVGSGEKPPYAEIKDDSLYLVKIFFPNTLLLWTTLWLVKFALLLQCRRLIDRQPSYRIIWWIIVGFCGIFFVGCVTSELTSCESMHAWFTFRGCQSKRDARAATISLFYSFAVDILTDLAIMIFPLRILWHLQLNLVRKVSIMAIFGVGIICMVTSIVRVVQIGSKSNSKQPSPSWLAVWAIIEASIAVVVGCLPTFGLLLPTQKPSKYQYGYSNSNSHSKSGHRERMQKEGFELRSRDSVQGLREPVIEGNAWTERAKDSGPPNSVLVTTTMNVDDRSDGDGDSSHKWPLPAHQMNHMV